MKPIPKKQIKHNAILSNGMYAVWTDGTLNENKGKYMFDVDIYQEKENKKPIKSLRNISSLVYGAGAEFPDMVDYLEGLVSEKD